MSKWKQAVVALMYVCLRLWGGVRKWKVRENGRLNGIYRWVISEREWGEREGEGGMRVRQPRIMIAGIMKWIRWWYMLPYIYIFFSLFSIFIFVCLKDWDWDWDWEKSQNISFIRQEQARQSDFMPTRMLPFNLLPPWLPNS